MSVWWRDRHAYAFSPSVGKSPLRLRNLTIVTNGIEAGLALAKNSSHTVILVGGVLRPDGTSVVGHLGARILENLYVKTALVSCSGFTLQAGLTEADIQQVLLKSKMIGCAERVLALIDSTSSAGWT